MKIKYIIIALILSFNISMASVALSTHIHDCHEEHTMFESQDEDCDVCASLLSKILNVNIIETYIIKINCFFEEFREEKIEQNEKNVTLVSLKIKLTE